MTSTRPTTYRLSPEVYEYRKNNHLCFRCGDKYTPGHKCKNRQLNCIKGITEDGQAAWATPTETSEIIEEQALTDVIIEGEIQQEMQEAICLSALSGNHNGVSTILVKGIAKNRNLTVMVDSGSTHSFIDSQAVMETGYVETYSSPMRVTVADGNYLLCNSTCTSFSWKMEGKSFREDLRIIKLGGCDIVLGNDWMKKYNPTKFDHKKRSVTIEKNPIKWCCMLLLKREVFT
ncbi:hypothetical protein KY290_004964 [Solanum tuberosum]|uniref:Uncharacterized protein n=1 Tax=Solanum tuberosum TaxID=4113 RepID=A0ABQ7WCR7_SOLTU|nr:hypothetical protein KY284_005080 [Solanum tuberosum]KAH0722283.1 hypothetical protein KY289_005327 [Solanum tuberosum]KAH0778537.1 hypothetical protein KY290_004964 [Solanum tuberosum]